MQHNIWSLPWTNNIIGPVVPWRILGLWFGFFKIIHNKTVTYCNKVTALSKKPTKWPIYQILSLKLKVWLPQAISSSSYPLRRGGLYQPSIHSPVDPNYFQLWAKQRSHVWGETSISFSSLHLPFFSSYQNPAQKWSRRRKEREVGSAIQRGFFSLCWCRVSQVEKRTREDEKQKAIWILQK